MDLRLIFVVLTLLQCYTVHSQTSEDPTTALNSTSSDATTTAAVTPKDTSTKPGGTGPSGAETTVTVAAAATTQPKQLTCRVGPCADTKATCTAFKTTTQCAVGEVCGLVLGNGNDTLNTYDFSCAPKVCTGGGIICCEVDNCMPGDTDGRSTGTHVHINFVTFVLMLSAILCFV